MGSTVEIGFFEVNGMIEFRIIDQGPGFDGNSVVTTKASGSGLGLESTREILKQLEGELQFMKNPNMGTTTIVRFPLAKKIDYHDQEVWLVEDDKYVRSLWRTAATKASINLKIFSSLPSELPSKNTVVYLDRFLGDVDSSEWSLEAIENGATVHSISALGSASKAPPWSLHI